MFLSLMFLQKEKYHSRLAIFYLDQIQNLRKEPKSPKEAIENARYGRTKLWRSGKVQGGSK